VRGSAIGARKPLVTGASSLWRPALRADARLAAGTAARSPMRMAATRKLKGTAKTKEDGTGTMKSEGPQDPERRGRSLSWTAMLWIVLFAILVAAGCAYLVVSPFFHQHVPIGSQTECVRPDQSVRSFEGQRSRVLPAQTCMRSSARPFAACALG
jgi:hypothetical protein